MRRLARSLMVAGTLVGLAGLAWPPGLGADERRHEGRTLEEWRRNLRDPAPEVRYRSVQALEQFEDAAVPALIEALQDADPGVSATAAAVLPRLGLGARAAVPTLAALVVHGDEVIRYAAVESLVRIEPAAVVPALVRGLSDDSAAVRRDAADALASLAAMAKGAVPPELPPMLLHPFYDRSRDPTLRGPMRQKLDPSLQAPLQVMAGSLQSAVPGLLRVLVDDDPGARMAAETALQTFGAPALPALVQALAEPALGPAAVRALTRTPGGHSPATHRAVRELGAAAVPALVRVLQDPGFRGDRWFATLLLEKIGPAAKDGVPALVQALYDADARPRRAAASALGAIGPEAREAVPALRRLAASDPDPGVREVATAALERIGRR